MSATFLDKYKSSIQTDYASAKQDLITTTLKKISANVASVAEKIFTAVLGIAVVCAWSATVSTASWIGAVTFFGSVHIIVEHAYIHLLPLHPTIANITLAVSVSFCTRLIFEIYAKAMHILMSPFKITLRYILSVSRIFDPLSSKLATAETKCIDTKNAIANKWNGVKGDWLALVILNRQSKAYPAESNWNALPGEIHDVIAEYVLST